MAVFSSLFLEFGIQAWFSDSIRSTVTTSHEVAQEYMVEQRETMNLDIQGLSLEYEGLGLADRQNKYRLQFLATDALHSRRLNEVILFQERDGFGDTLAEARSANLVETPTVFLTPEIVSRARSGETVVIENPVDANILAVRRLSSYLEPTYLFIARDVSPKVLNYLKRTQDAVSVYNQLEADRGDLLLQFNMVFMVVALLILMVAVMIGIRFSSRLVTPLSNLVTASERVGKGDLGVRVPNLSTTDEVGVLSRAFNRMTDQLARQQEDLIARRRFLEEVLAGVSAGVIGLKPGGEVFLANRSASLLLARSEKDLIGSILFEQVPEVRALVDQAESSAGGTAQGPVELSIDDDNRTFLVRISVENANEEIAGYVVTFDDLTEQLAAQRTAAWADVARRIAHEIKNPLTPIQLSAERLKRKYSNEIQTDPQIFDQCTATIIRQVGDLRRMVNEFSSFARMPAPVFKETDLIDTVRQAVFLQDVASSNILFKVSLPAKMTPLSCDGRLLGQAVTNLVKNAVEAVEARLDNDAKHDMAAEPGKITVIVSQTDERTRIEIVDNGAGLPAEQKDRLMEPYVTTRSKGTGLGLAIVRKIVEDHGGTVRLNDRQAIGARATLTLSHAALEKKAGVKAGTKNMDAAE